MIFQALIGDRTISLDIQSNGRHPQVTIDGNAANVDIVALSQFSCSLLIDGQSHHLSIRPSRDGYQVLLREQTYQVELRTEREQAIERLGLASQSLASSGTVRAPIPGLIASIAVAVGDVVEEGQTLLILEAMKMENDLAAPAAGSILSIDVGLGDAVEKGATLLTIG